MHRNIVRPFIRYTIDDEDAVCTTTYVLRVSYSKCPGYRATWGYDGGCPGENDHVDDVIIDAIESVEIAGVKVVPNDAMLKAIREKFDGCEAIEEKCYEAAFCPREQ